jgi:hypothetical protein
MPLMLARASTHCPTPRLLSALHMCHMLATFNLEEIILAQPTGRETRGIYVERRLRQIEKYRLPGSGHRGSLADVMDSWMRQTTMFQHAQLINDAAYHRLWRYLFQGT